MVVPDWDRDRDRCRCRYRSMYQCLDSSQNRQNQTERGDRSERRNQLSRGETVTLGVLGGGGPAVWTSHGRRLGDGGSRIARGATRIGRARSWCARGAGSSADADIYRAARLRTCIEAGCPALAA